MQSCNQRPLLLLVIDIPALPGDYRKQLSFNERPQMKFAKTL